MTTITAFGELLTASTDERTLTYRLLPYGVPGRTNKGLVTAAKGSVTVPDDVSSLWANTEHDATRPVAQFVSVDEDAGGLTATVRVLATSAGDDLLVEATEGARKGMSVELGHPVIRNGELLSSELSGAGCVVKPAFAGAELLTAADVGELSPEQVAEFEDAGVYLPADSASTDTRDEIVEVNGRRYRLITESAHTSQTTITPEDGDDTGEAEADEDEAEETTDDTASSDQEEDNMTASKAASAPADLRASAAKGSGRLLASDSNPKDLFRLLADAGKTRDSQLTAALVDITQTGAIGNTEVPQYVGELWDGRATERRVVPLFNHADLTSYKVNGWRWVTKPVVGPYTGDKAAIPSNAVSTEPVELAAERIAGGHDIDRKYVDFGDEGFWQSYVAAMTESYAVQSDAAVMTDVLAAATSVVEGVGDAVEGVPEVWIKIVDGVLAVLQNTNAMPSSAVLAFDMYRQFLLTPQDGGLEYLNAALGFENGTVNESNFAVLPHAGVAAGGVLVSAREAVTVHELSTTPIRVEAQNIANGGIDVGVFGYYATNIHDADGLVLVTGTPAPAA